MIPDASLILSGAIASNGGITGLVANGAGSFISTNTIDMGPPGLGGIPARLADTGAGEPLTLLFQVRTSPTVGTSVRFQLIQADDPALTSNVQVLRQSDDIPIANLPAGRLVFLTQGRTDTPKSYFGARIVNQGAIATLSNFASVVANAQSRLDRTLQRSGYAIT